MRFLCFNFILSLTFLMALSGKAMSPNKLNQNEVIVFFGDSITKAGVEKDGYITLFSKAVNKAMPAGNIKIIGAGKSGNRINDLGARLDLHVLKHKTTLVIIYIGINDVWLSKHNLGTPKPYFEKTMKDLVERCEKAGARVIICTPSVIGEKADGSNEFDKMLDEFSAVSRKVAKEKGCQLVDFRKKFIEYLKVNNKENKQKGILTVDSVHPNKKGNQLIADIFLEELNIKK